MPLPIPETLLPVNRAIERACIERAGVHQATSLTDDPDLHLLVAGHRVNAVECHGRVHVFRLPRVTGDVRIISRTVVPAEIGLALDSRLLGVAVRRLAVRQGSRFRLTEAEDAILADGFHPFEAATGWRWTNGKACLPSSLFRCFTGPRELMLHLGGTLRYIAAGQRKAA